MSISIEGIKFNYDPDHLEKTGAINLRRNEKQTVPIPEWQPDHCSNYECSPVAYRLDAVPEQVLIEASFFVQGQFGAPLRIRGIAISPDQILGDTSSEVIPGSGSSGFVRFVLPSAALGSAAIGIHDVEWRWEYSDHEINRKLVWIEFQRTKHRVYCVLSAPNEPWEFNSSRTMNIHQPWTEVLDYACTWAEGIRLSDPLIPSIAPLDAAASRITKCVYSLGDHLVKWARSASYAGKNFDCTKFLNLLKTGIGGTQTVNCDDCATIVSTFANILGCDLYQSSLGSHFKTNFVRLVGFDWDTKVFIHHGVAWKAECEVDDEVFDACLQVDNDGRPELQPFKPIQPVNLKFGVSSDKAYSFCLVNSETSARPIPNDIDYGRRRRKFGNRVFGDLAISGEELISILKDLYSFSSWPAVPKTRLSEDTVFQDRSQLEAAFEGWNSHSFVSYRDERFADAIEAILRRPEEGTQQLLAVNVYHCAFSADPNFVLLQLLGEWTEVNLHRLAQPRVGDITFESDDRSVIIFRRNRMIGVVRSAGRHPTDVRQFGLALDLLLREGNHDHDTSPKQI